MNANFDSIDRDDGGLAESLSAFAPVVQAQSLYLLRAFESTMDHLGTGSRLAESVAVAARELTARLRDVVPAKGTYIDPDDVMVSRIEEGYRVLEEHLPVITVKKAAIEADRQLKPEQCDALHCGFDEYVSAIAELIEAAKDLRAAVISHDLAAEPRGQSHYDSARELIEALHG